MLTKSAQIQKLNIPQETSSFTIKQKTLKQRFSYYVKTITVVERLPFLLPMQLRHVRNYSCCY